MINHEEIRKALDQAERLPSYQDHVKNNATRWLRAMLEEKSVELWDCPHCGFAFHTDHKDVKGGEYSCPHCAEIRLEAQLQQLREELEQVKKERDEWSQRTKQAEIQLAAKDKVLEWYANESNYHQPKPFAMPFIEVDKGITARSILSHYKGLPKAPGTTAQA